MNYADAPGESSIPRWAGIVVDAHVEHRRIAIKPPTGVSTDRRVAEERREARIHRTVLQVVEPGEGPCHRVSGSRSHTSQLQFSLLGARGYDT